MRSDDYGRGIMKTHYSQTERSRQRGDEPTRHILELKATQQTLMLELRTEGSLDNVTVRYIMNTTDAANLAEAIIEWTGCRFIDGKIVPEPDEREATK